MFPWLETPDRLPTAVVLARCLRTGKTRRGRVWSPTLERRLSSCNSRRSGVTGTHWALKACTMSWDCDRSMPENRGALNGAGPLIRTPGCPARRGLGAWVGRTIGRGWGGTGWMGQMGGGFWPGGNASTSTVVVRTVEPLNESSEQRFLGGMGGISRAPATAAEPPEKRKMPVRNASFMSQYCH